MVAKYGFRFDGEDHTINKFGDVTKMGIPYLGNLSYYQSLVTNAYDQYKDVAILKEEKKIKGYASGGYTGNGGKYEVAGLVHKGEYVVNQDQMRNVGGVGAVESFVNGGNKELTSVMNTLISYTKSILKENRELTALFKRVTNGGENMVVSLDA